jgi:hypothetical protein
MKFSAKSRKVRSEEKFVEIIEVKELAVRANLMDDDKNKFRKIRVQSAILNRIYEKSSEKDLLCSNQCQVELGKN